MKENYIKRTTRELPGAGLVFAGISHLTFARKDFRAQVPNWAPLKKDESIVYSGITEIALGSALAFSPKSGKKTFGKIAARFFTAVFPGNLALYTHDRDAFGLNTPGKRFMRLSFQPFLILWALKSTH